MNKHELLRKISAFHLVSRELAEDLLAGDFASVFRGQGMEFDEVRHYEMGDDVRSIDWNVTARFGEPYVKLYREERELSLCIVLDCSPSMHTGLGRGRADPAAALTRYEQGILTAALLAFSAERSGQRVGAVFFDTGIMRVWSPRKGRAHIMHILNSALEDAPPGRGSGLGKALAGTARILRNRRFRRGAPRSLVAVISDFMAIHWERELGDISAKHDVIALRITDPSDGEMPDAGLAALEDRETGTRFHVPTAFSSFRSARAEWHGDRSRLWQAICRRSGAARVELSTADDAPGVLARFFRGRRR
jgi:uncharacterized protein (DUF58 family)